jgi:hypothetical protein
MFIYWMSCGRLWRFDPFLANHSIGWRLDWVNSETDVYVGVYDAALGFSEESVAQRSDLSRSDGCVALELFGLRMFTQQFRR